MDVDAEYQFIHIQLNKENFEENVYDYRKLLNPTDIPMEEAEREESEESDSEQEEGAETDKIQTENETELGKKKRKSRTHAEDEYDYDDDFIDDDELVYDSEIATILPPSNWNFGYFAWKGDIETFIETLPEDVIDEATSKINLKKKKSKGKSRDLESLEEDADPLKSGTVSEKSSPAKTTTQDEETLKKDKKKKGIVTDPSSAQVPVILNSKSSSLNDFVIPQTNSANTSASASPKKKRKSTNEAEDNSKRKRISEDLILRKPTTLKIGEVVVPSAPGIPEKRKSVPAKITGPLNPEVNLIFENLKDLASKESFEDKKHFPDSLRPILKEAAKTADATSSLDDNFFGHLISILPYNTFTMKKLVGKMMMNVKKEELAALYESFMGVVTAAISQQQLLVPTLPLTQEEKAEDDSKRKFRWKQGLKGTLARLVELELEIADLHNEWIAKSGKSDILEVEDVKKQAFEKITSCFPEEIMSVTDIGKIYLDYVKMQVKKAAKVDTKNVNPEVVNSS